MGAMLTRREFQMSLLAAGTLPEGCAVDVRWQGELCRARITNKGRQSVAVGEVVMLELPHEYPAATRVYGEGFTMLSQTGGTLGQPEDIGGYTDRKHYRIPEPGDALTVYNALALAPPQGESLLLGFTSCRRFSGRFHVRARSIQVTMDGEGRMLGAGESWELEELGRWRGADAAALWTKLAARIETHHPRLAWAAPPEGWCSWYCFGPSVTAQQVRDNLEWIGKNAPFLRYVQIDDGYQPAMGDWLETGAAFGGDIRSVLKEIKERGFEPAIWVAPFIAEAKSRLFREHPEWFMQAADGTPLASNQVTFGGWRRGPWYALDATNAGARAHLTRVFRTMNREWGCTYFKMDANFWGAMHGGRLRDPRATRIEAYRMGMQAIVEGAGPSFLLGCNHPMWPSLGLIHGSRSSGDISRKWGTIKKVSEENLRRAWQNGRLWWNDPDALVLLGALPEEEFLFHVAATLATGGMLLSGDDLTKMPAARLALLKKLRPTGVAAQFDPELRVGRMALRGRELVFLLNWEDRAAAARFAVAGPQRVRDYLTGEDLGMRSGLVELGEMAAHSGRVLEVV